MSVMVTCTIKIVEKDEYLTGQEVEILSEHSWSGSSALFRDLPIEIIEKFLEQAITKANEGTIKKLKVIK